MRFAAQKAFRCTSRSSLRKRRDLGPRARYSPFEPRRPHGAPHPTQPRHPGRDSRAGGQPTLAGPRRARLRHALPPVLRRADARGAFAAATAPLWGLRAFVRGALGRGGRIRAQRCRGRRAPQPVRRRWPRPRAAHLRRVATVGARQPARRRARRRAQLGGRRACRDVPRARRGGRQAGRQDPLPPPPRRRHRRGGRLRSARPRGPAAQVGRAVRGASDRGGRLSAVVGAHAPEGSAARPPASMPARAASRAACTDAISFTDWRQSALACRPSRPSM